MRDIKFRAWDTNSKKMFDCSKIQDYSLEQVERLNSANDPYTKFMQYAGLIDKNGIEVYEGDILINVVANSKYGVVCFEDGMFIMRADNNDYIHHYLSELCKHSEIIGNIYENPDLIKG